MQHDEQATGRVVVIGSANEDLVLSVAGLPTPGATVLAAATATGPGGKGANQAVAAARAGAEVSFIGAVGDDDRGARLLDNLVRQRVDVSQVRRVSDPTGLAVVLVAADGGNVIVVASGANERVVPSSVDAALDALDPSNVVLLQCEIAPSVIEHVVTRAAILGATVVLNLAPYTELDPEVLSLVDVLVVNETEAREVLGDGGDSDAVGSPAGVPALELAPAVHRRFGCTAIVTLGERGSVLGAGGDLSLHVPPVDVEHVVDTTGAGDVYVGTLAARIAAGETVPDAMEHASRRAADSVSTHGAQAPDEAVHQLT